jgi:hypothetical protein
MLSMWGKIKMNEDKSKHVILAQHGPAGQGSVRTKCQSHWEATWIQNDTRFLVQCQTVRSELLHQT